VQEQKVRNKLESFLQQWISLRSALESEKNASNIASFSKDLSRIGPMGEQYLRFKNVEMVDFNKFEFGIGIFNWMLIFW
jgi:hypothetical protein